MSRKRILSLALGFAVLAVLFSGCFPRTTRRVYVRRTSRAGKGYIWIKLSSGSRVAWAYLKINNKGFGTIRRGQWRKFWLRTGMRHRIVVRRVWRGRVWRRTKYVSVYSGQTKRLIMRPIGL